MGGYLPHVFGGQPRCKHWKNGHSAYSTYATARIFLYFRDIRAALNLTQPILGFEMITFCMHCACGRHWAASLVFTVADKLQAQCPATGPLARFCKTDAACSNGNPFMTVAPNFR